jgi:hypothetical protein
MDDKLVERFGEFSPGWTKFDILRTLANAGLELHEGQGGSLAYLRAINADEEISSEEETAHTDSNRDDRSVYSSGNNNLSEAQVPVVVGSPELGRN